MAFCLVRPRSGPRFASQEETTGLGIPWFSIRENTERPITIEEGTNTVIGCTGDGILQAFNRFKNDRKKKGIIPEFWDGRAAKRLVEILIKDLNPEPLNLER